MSSSSVDPRNGRKVTGSEGPRVLNEQLANLDPQAIPSSEPDYDSKDNNKRSNDAQNKHHHEESQSISLENHSKNDDDTTDEAALRRQKARTLPNFFKPLSPVDQELLNEHHEVIDARTTQEYQLLRDHRNLIETASPSDLYEGNLESLRVAEISELGWDDSQYMPELKEQKIDSKKWAIWIINILGLIVFVIFYIPFMYYLAQPGRLGANSWAYDYNGTSPPFWSQLSRSNELCSTAYLQSPINIYNKNVVLGGESRVGTLLSGPKAGTYHLYFDRSPIMRCQSNCQSLAWDGISYTLSSITFHGSSEHAIDSIIPAMETQLRFVGKDANGHSKIAILSIFYAANSISNNTLLNQVWFDNMNVTGASETYFTIKSFQTNEIYDTLSGYYHYKGSETIPPCSTDVDWILQERIMDMSIDQQLFLFAMVGYPGNKRDLQPLGDRIVTKYSTLMVTKTVK